MTIERNPISLKEVWFRHKQTRLGMLIDPPNQTIPVVRERTVQFAYQGGGAILIGGSGQINDDIFQRTVDAVVQARTNLPVIIFPGHANQIPIIPDGISGVLNYRLIVGAKGPDFDSVFPPRERVHFDETLKQRKIPNISTLYILCGDPNASVSKVTGIKPFDTSNFDERKRLLEIVAEWLNKKVDCIFFEAGSHAATSVRPEMVTSTRNLIDRISPETMLFVGGGIFEPQQAEQYKNAADCISIGTYFENHGVVNVDKFLTAIN